MPLGGLNPLPFRIGGEQTPTQKIYGALASSVGKGGTGPAGGLRELWRLCIARAVAEASVAKDLAALQAFPQTMTVAIPAAERFYALPLAGNEVDRRAEVWAATIYDPSATGPDLGAALRAIDPAFAIETLPWRQSSVMVPGKAFGPLPGDAGPTFGSGQSAGTYSAPWCNYSDSFIVRVRYVLASWQTEIPVPSYELALRLLSEACPAFSDFCVYNVVSGPDGDGFYLDGGPPSPPADPSTDGTSLLEMTAL